MLASISLTLNFTAPSSINEEQLLARITAAVRAAAAQPPLSSLGKEEPSSTVATVSGSFKIIENANLQSLEKGEVADEGWGQVTNLHSIIESLPKDQKKVVLQAIENGGQVSRSETFKIIGRPEDKSLNGFTKPVKALMKRLKEKQELPEDAVSLLSPIYDDTGRYQPAQGFKVPLQVVTKMRSWAKME